MVHIGKTNYQKHHSNETIFQWAHMVSDQYINNHSLCGKTVANQNQEEYIFHGHTIIGK